MTIGVLGATPVGRRERKKQQTREHIAETARRLFAERSFDSVTIAEIADRADVSEQTVYNHFATKEDLVYWRMVSFEEELLAAVRDRPPGDTVLAAFGRFVRRPRGLMRSDDPEEHERIAGLMRTIVDSPALLAREQAILRGYTSSLATVLAEETGVRADEIEPWIAATAMLGAHGVLIDFARQRILAGARPPRVSRELRARTDRALALLETGFGTYAVKPPTPPMVRLGT